MVLGVKVEGLGVSGSGGWGIVYTGGDVKVSGPRLPFQGVHGDYDCVGSIMLPVRPRRLPKRLGESS